MSISLRALKIDIRQVLGVVVVVVVVVGGVGTMDESDLTEAVFFLTLLFSSAPVVSPRNGIRLRRSYVVDGGEGGVTLEAVENDDEDNEDDSLSFS